MLSEVSQVQKNKRSHVFSLMWKIDPNTNTSTVTQNIFPIIGPFEETRGKGEGEENERE
jgi:hypothetical protein